jgi:beta-1,4-mannosyltransferase
VLTPALPASLAVSDARSTIFTTVSNSLASHRSTRPALLVSSTSWTADEDFSLLLTALDAYQAASTASASSALPHLLVLITGKGPLRAGFERLVHVRESQGRWTNVTARCLFVEARDYPTLLGCADLGVSLHTSSSGRDLPMKIVDMFGCGVPVLAKRFACLGELVKEGQNGRSFSSGEELGEDIKVSLEIRAGQTRLGRVEREAADPRGVCTVPALIIQSLLSEFPENKDLKQLQSYFRDQSDEKARSRAGTPVVDLDEWTTWEKNWDRVVFKGILRKERK